MSQKQIQNQLLYLLLYSLHYIGTKGKHNSRELIYFV